MSCFIYIDKILLKNLGEFKKHHVLYVHISIKKNILTNL